MKDSQASKQECIGKSGHVYTLERRSDGRTAVDLVNVREGKNAKGRALGLLLGTVGKRTLAHQLSETVKAIEARNDSQPGAEQG